MARSCCRGSCPRDGKRRWLVIPACGPVQMDLCDRHDLEIRETFGQLGRALERTIAAALAHPLSRTEPEPVGFPPAGSRSGAGPDSGMGSLPPTGPDPKADGRLGTYYLTRHELETLLSDFDRQVERYARDLEARLRIEQLTLAMRLYIVAADVALGTGEW